MHKKELHNDSGDIALSNAIHDFKFRGDFEIEMKISFDLSDLEYVRGCCLNLLGIHLPYDYVVEMLVRDHAVAREVNSRDLDDTHGRELLLNYFAAEVMHTRWPIYGDGVDAGVVFHEKFDKLVEERGWKK